MRDNLTKKLPTSLQKHQGRERPGKTETVPGAMLGGTSNSKWTLVRKLVTSEQNLQLTEISSLINLQLTKVNLFDLITV